MNTSKGQVQLSELIFTMSWEDPACDRNALHIQPSDNLVTVTSGGCNTLALLLEDPKEVFAVDINPAQSYVLELKMAAMRTLEYPDFLGFLGVREDSRRLKEFGAMKEELSSEALIYWKSHQPLVEKGFLGQGKYEQFISLFRTLLRVLQGGNRIKGLFENQTVEKQRSYFDEVWNTRRWQGLFKIFFSKTVLGRRGLSADYFQFDDGSASFAESFLRRAQHAMADLPTEGNYFLAQYLLGRYLGSSQLPDYLLEHNFETIRKRISRIRIVTADLKQWMESQPARSFDCYALSNICELMDQRDTFRTFREVARTAKPGARMSFRNLMINRTVPDELATQIIRDDTLSKELKSKDRSFVYSRVDALYLGSRT